MQLSATEAKGRFGEIMAADSDEVVTITKYGRPDKAVISYKRLQELEAIEDRYWVELARQGRESGYIGTKESDKLLLEMMNRED